MIYTLRAFVMDYEMSVSPHDRAEHGLAARVAGPHCHRGTLRMIEHQVTIRLHNELKDAIGGQQYWLGKSH